MQVIRLEKRDVFPQLSHPKKRFKSVRILYEDDISWYVKSLTLEDSRGNGVHYSVKKHCFQLLPIKDAAKKKIKPLQRDSLIRVLELIEESIRTPVDRAGIILRADNWIKIRIMVYHMLGITETGGNRVYYRYMKKRLEQRNQGNRRY